MRMLAMGLLLAGAVWAQPAAVRPAGAPLGVGRAATPDEIKAWDLTVMPDGKNLPAGQGTPAQGAEVYERQCQSCHGVAAKGGTAEALVGGQGTLATAKPVKTVTSYWPRATTIFDYVRRAMPYNTPGTLTNDQVYAVTAYVLQLDGIIGASDVMNAETLPKVRMPNRDGFVRDPRPDKARAAGAKK
jgi:mono/diheme cytochrome c family protein